MFSLYLKTYLYKKNSSSLDKSECSGNSLSELKCAISAFNVSLTPDIISECSGNSPSELKCASSAFNIALTPDIISSCAEKKQTALYQL